MTQKSTCTRVSFPIKFQKKKRLRYRCFLVNIANFFNTFFLSEFEGGGHFFNFSILLPHASQTLRHLDLCTKLTTGLKLTSANRCVRIFEYVSRDMTDLHFSMSQFNKQVSGGQEQKRVHEYFLKMLRIMSQRYTDCVLKDVFPQTRQRLKLLKNFSFSLMLS